MDFNNLHFDQIQFLESILFEGLGHEVAVESYQFLSGGDINTALRIDTGEGYYFVKWNESAGEELFACESQGLQMLREAEAIRVPEVINYGRKAEKAYLLLEFISSARPQPAYWERFGEQLAALHAHTGSAFGLPYDNYIGSLEQRNTPTDNGVLFFIESRLQVQAGLAFYNGQLPKNLYDKFTALYERLPELLPAERPALVHGDLWSGNVLVDERGACCLIDPAVHYGLREAEVAFTKLFGGFEDTFYGAYESAFPLAPGFAQRVELYNLYPLLVHLNLFGSGYLSGIERVLRKF
jgi:fructosamine-3-kinase